MSAPSNLRVAHRFLLRKYADDYEDDHKETVRRARVSRCIPSYRSRHAA